jgi:1-phosphofructokinase
MELNMTQPIERITTVTLNPAIDQTVSIPDFAPGKVNRVVRSQSDPGGKGVNVAAFLSDYGLPVIVTGFLGEENRYIFERMFLEKGIDDRFVRIAGSTRVGIKIVDDLQQQTTDINFPGQAPTVQDVDTLFDIIQTLSGECGWFVLSGSIPAGMPASIYRELVERIQATGKQVALDTSGEGLQLALSAAPDLVKPNIDELEQLVGRQLPTRQAVVQAARSLIARGIKTVVVSMGSEGAIFVNAREVVLALPPQVTVKSTVGAGDAMVAGTLAALAQGKSLAECSRLATAFAVMAISQIGSGLPSIEALEEITQQVDVQIPKSFELEEQEVQNG